MAEVARDKDKQVDPSETQTGTKRPGVDFPVAIKFNNKPIVMTNGVVLEEGKEYPPGQQHELPDGFAWVGAEGENRKLVMGRKPDPHARTIEVEGDVLKVEQVYPSSKQHDLPAGYKWGSMMYGLDGEGGVNRMLVFEEAE